MHFNRALYLVKRFYPLVFIPIVLDLLQINDILSRVRDFNVKFTIPSAIPSLTQVLADPPGATGGGFTVNLPFSHLGGIALLLFIVFLSVSLFLKGGFLGTVLAGIKGDEVNLDSFIRNGKDFFVRFLLQFVVLTLAMFFIVPFVFVLGPFSVILFIGILILFFYLILWDYAMVAENKMLITAAETSYKIVGANKGKVFSFIIPILIFTAIFSMLANAIVASASFLVILAIGVYGYMGTAVVFAMMSFYLEISNEDYGGSNGNFDEYL